MAAHFAGTKTFQYPQVQLRLQDIGIGLANAFLSIPTGAIEVYRVGSRIDAIGHLSIPTGAIEVRDGILK